jgi:hypothetical protein
MSIIIENEIAYVYRDKMRTFGRTDGAVYEI